MKSLVIKLDTINDVMGIFSLDLAKSIKMEIYSDDCAAFLDEVKDFSVDK